MSIILSYQLTGNDYFEFAYYTSWKASWNKRKRVNYFLNSFLYGAVLIAALVYFFEKKFSITSIGTILIFFLIYFPLLIIFTKENYKRLTRKIYNDPKNAGLFSKAEVSIDETGISVKDEFSRVEYKWTAITKISSIQNLYLLYLSEITAIIIPKRIFRTASEKDSFKRILAQYLPL